MAYDLVEHRHRFAVWAAARAAQRGLTSVEVLRECLETTDLAQFARKRTSLRTGNAAFEKLHRDWCSRILRALRMRGLEAATYGHAAKLVAIYLKSMIVVGPGAGSRLSAVIHPPIDAILLQNVTRYEKKSGRLAKWRGTSWTSLDKRSYYELIEDLRGLLRPGEPFWILERFWTVTR